MPVDTAYARKSEDLQEGQQWRLIKGTFDERADVCTGVNRERRDKKTTFFVCWQVRFP
jgi:hypothetical protein